MSKIKEYLVPTLVLFVICFVSAVLLGITNEVTSPIIAENDVKSQQEAMQTVVPGAAEFKEDDSYTNEFGTYAVALDKDGNVIGYAVTAIGKGGYDGDIKVMVGIDAEGKIIEIEDTDGNKTAAVSILDQSETKTIGVKKVINNTKEFLAQFIGLSENVGIGEGQVNAVSGATKTSTGVADGVSNALKCYKEVSANG